MQNLGGFTFLGFIQNYPASGIGYHYSSVYDTTRTHSTTPRMLFRR